MKHQAVCHSQGDEQNGGGQKFGLEVKHPQSQQVGGQSLAVPWQFPGARALDLAQLLLLQSGDVTCSLQVKGLETYRDQRKNQTYIRIPSGRGPLDSWATAGISRCLVCCRPLLVITTLFFPKILDPKYF